MPQVACTASYTTRVSRSTQAVSQRVVARSTRPRNSSASSYSSPYTPNRRVTNPQNRNLPPFSTTSSPPPIPPPTPYAIQVRKGGHPLVHAMQKTLKKPKPNPRINNPICINQLPCGKQRNRKILSSPHLRPVAIHPVGQSGTPMSLTLAIAQHLGTDALVARTLVSAASRLVSTRSETLRNTGALA